MKTLILLSLLTLGILLFTRLAYTVQVDGYCDLENQSNHAGTRVLFQAITPSAHTDSTFTDSLGYYQKDIAIGLYNIAFRHQGFGNKNLNGRMLSAPTTLSNITLPDIPDGIYISGALFETLIDTIYIVEADIWVGQDSSLTISPGARLYFLSEDTASYHLTIRGELIAIGTEQDSIKFLSAQGYFGWCGIEFESASQSAMEYCLLTDVNWNYVLSLYSYYDDGVLMVNHCNISGNALFSSSAAIHCYGGICTISDCAIFDNIGINSYGIYVYGSTSVDIQRCVIDQAYTGILVNSWDSEHVEIANCLVRHSGHGGIAVEGYNAIIRNCTVSQCLDYGILCSHSTAVVVNCILDNDHQGIWFDYSLNASASFCDFSGNTGGNFYGNSVPHFLGQIVTENNNGDSCDVYMNIFLDPMFMNPEGGDYHLQAGSPCIDAGDPTSHPDPDGTIADIGAFYFSQSGVIDNGNGAQIVSEFRLLPCYPNPFNSTLTIPFTVPIQSDISIMVYNILGQRVKQFDFFMFEPGIHRIQWNPTINASGLYLIRLSNGFQNSTQRVLYLK
jgi:hypothetical protein